MPYDDPLMSPKLKLPLCENVLPKDKWFDPYGRETITPVRCDAQLKHVGDCSAWWQR